MTVRAIMKLPGREPQYITLPNDGAAQYAELKRLVGGYVELIHLSEKYVAVINEEGIPLGLDWNIWLGPETPIAGPIILGRAAPDTEAGPILNDMAEMELMMSIQILSMGEPMTGKASFGDFQKLTGRPGIEVKTWNPKSKG